jgi:acylphosphatase
MIAIRRRVLVSGRVQGVFFRASCAKQARARGLAGSVCNRPDGRVEAVFEGRPEDVEALVAWCRRGPAGARVERIEIVDEAPARGSTGFEVAAG